LLLGQRLERRDELALRGGGERRQAQLDTQGRSYAERRHRLIRLEIDANHFAPLPESSLVMLTLRSAPSSG
jgi:hypothetical protein